MWRRPSCRRLGEQRDTPGVAWAGELGETPCEVAAGVVRGRVELCRKLAHGKQRSRGNCVFRHHSFGKGTDRLTLNVPILDVAEAVLKLFELPDGALVDGWFVQRREELEHVAQFLAAFAHKM